jgi:hypothetical protein
MSNINRIAILSGTAVKKYAGQQVFSRFLALLQSMAEIEQHIPSNQARQFLNSKLLCIEALSKAKSKQEVARSLVTLINIFDAETKSVDLCGSSAVITLRKQFLDAIKKIVSTHKVQGVR